MKSLTTLRAMLGVIILMLTGNSYATNILYTGTGFNDGNNGVTIGMEFTPQADIQVTQLGVFDGGSDGAGLQTSHDVGLWQYNGTPVTSVTVTAGSTLNSGFRFEAITPVILTAGQSYVLAAYYPDFMAGDKLVASSNPTATPFVTLGTTSLLQGGTGLTFPTAVTNPDFRITANLLFTAVVPIPPTLIGVLPATPGGTDYQAYYDPTANLTWLADANAGAGSAYDDGTYSFDGAMTWANANAWAASLDINGVTGWRLPTTLQPDSSCDYNDSIGSYGYGCTGSEMGNLFYTVLGNTAGVLRSNTGPFSNVEFDGYWSSTEYAPQNSAWLFVFSDGFQLPFGNKPVNNYAWAVHDGDVRIPPNLPPVAQNTSISTNQFVTINWTPNVSDPDGDALTCAIVTQPPANQGVASISPDCSTGGYDPQNFAGPSTTFTYQGNDGTAVSNVATVTVTVIPNPAPVAEDTTISAISGTSKTLDLSPYISDGKGDQDLTTLTISTAAINGAAISNGDGTVTYTSNTGFSGADTFGYTVDDAFGQTSNEGTVGVSVSVGIPPIADPSGPYVGIEGISVSFDGRGSSDLDGRVVSYAWNFGDGTTGTGFKPKHTYLAGGFYTASLTVTDNDGDKSTPSTTYATIASLNNDSDYDGLPDNVEDANGNGVVDPGETDPFNPDSDGDGMTDGYEINVGGTDPSTATTVYTLQCDMNYDDEVNVGDLLLLQRQLMGL